MTGRPYIEQQYIDRPIRFADESLHHSLRINAGGRTVATLYPDGRVEYDPADLDLAARTFWDAVAGYVSAAHEAKCPECGATIRARMADAPSESG